MRKLVGLLILGTIYLLLVSYFSYESIYLVNMSSYSEFLNAYLYNIQKYLFNITLLFMPLLYVLRVPFLKVEYYIRYGNNLTFYLISKGMIICLFLAFYIQLLFICIPLMYDFTIKLTDISILNILSLFSYLYLVYMVYVILYFLFENVITSLVSTFLLAFTINITYIAVVFLKNTLDDTWDFVFFNRIIAILNIFCILFVWYIIKNKEILK